MKYYNQNNYSDLKYPSSAHPSATIKSGGCGVVSSTILVNNLFDKEVYTVKAMRDLAIKCGARVAEGTNVATLLKAICNEYKELSFTTTSDENKLVEHLKKGGMAIANQGNAYEVFSSAGHFVVAYRMVGDNIEVVDPQMYDSKYKKSPKKDRIVKATSTGCIVSKNIIGKATADRTPSYYLITKTSIKKETPKSEKITYYNKYTGKSDSIVDALASLKIDSSFSNRKKIAAKNGMAAYTGSVAQNEKLLKLLKAGKLIK